MKFCKRLLCSAVLSASGAAQAGTLALNDLYGRVVGMNVVGATTDPVLTPVPAQPRFVLRNLSLSYSGYSMDDANFAITGLRGVMDFSAYSVDVYIPSYPGANATISQSHAVYEIGETGTVRWDAATRTLTLGQPLKYTDAKDSDMGGRANILTLSYVNQSSDAVANWSSEGVAASCAPVGSLGCRTQSPLFVDKPGMEKFFLSLTFDVNGGISGSAVSLDVGGKLPLGSTGNLLTLYTLETPIPAAAWLFGSALVGLGAARRRG